ncbi:rho GTPase-activating protein 36 isoform X2 [Amia ocellicauda]|uniref:rho GTPase-activating protein 36 isoform X2 n=1 Tax=Amia ocellicauda TaxID=2972642 RepID=UPI003463FD60
MDGMGSTMQTEDCAFLDKQFYYVGEHRWTTMFGQSVKLLPVPIQSLSELERARLQEVAFYHLEERELDCKISIPKETPKRRKSLRRKFDSFSKERKERETAPKAFGIPLSHVIANDRAHKQKQDALKESRRDCLDLEASVLRFRAEKQNKPPNSDPRTTLDLHNKHLSPTFLDNTSRSHRRGGLSVDSISDLVDSQSRLLEALQLSHPNELESKRVTGRPKKLSLNPIYRQVPRIVDRCCQHIEIYGLHTVGIFRVGSSKKRVRQLREEFDLGNDVILDDDHSVHDVAALLKEFLRDMPDPLLPRELYSAFLHANALKGPDRLLFLQQLVYLLPPCNCDTLQRLLQLLHTVHSHAQDTTGPDGQEISGNKMTAANLAVIFGPNLLQGEKATEKDYSQQSVGIEDSSSIISVTLELLQNYKSLFTVSAELQQEVLMSLLQTDSDVIDYLLRRKLRVSDVTSESDSSGRHCSSKSSYDSSTLSSGDISPLDASPIFSEQQGAGSLSSDIFLNLLRLNKHRNRSSEDSPRKPMNQTRQFYSHHNLMSLTQSPCGRQSEERDPVEQEKTVFHAKNNGQSSQESPSQSDAQTVKPGRGGESPQKLMGLSERNETPDIQTLVDYPQRLFSSGQNPNANSNNNTNPGPTAQMNQPPSPGDGVWVKQDTADTVESRPQSSPTNFWDFFTGKISGSETIV